MAEIVGQASDWVVLVFTILGAVMFVYSIGQWRFAAKGWQKASESWRGLAEVQREAIDQEQKAAEAWRELALSLMGDDQRRAFVDRLRTAEMETQVEQIPLNENADNEGGA